MKRHIVGVGMTTYFSITAEEYSEFCLFLEQESGIVLGSDKLYLVSSRLNNVMNNNHLATMADLIEKMKRPQAYKLRESVVDAMTTNETNWFRDVHPYNILVEKVLPQYKNAEQTRIWSAGCSTGQEPYSISMSVSEYGEKISWTLFGNSVKILGTDISATVLHRAKKGEYSKIEMERGVSEERYKRFFAQIDDKTFKIKEPERSRVTFHPHNLLASFSLLGKFDVIFCRNALIYFSPAAKINIIDRFANILNDNGYLFLGSSESMPQQCSQFKIIHCDPGIIYQKI